MKHRKQTKTQSEAPKRPQLRTRARQALEQLIEQSPPDSAIRFQLRNALNCVK